MEELKQGDKKPAQKPKVNKQIILKKGSVISLNQNLQLYLVENDFKKGQNQIRVR